MSPTISAPRTGVITRREVHPGEVSRLTRALHPAPHGAR
jgi:hypothetical protein